MTFSSNPYIGEAWPTTYTAAKWREGNVPEEEENA